MTTVRPRRVLVLTADRVGPVMAGPAIRAVELARVLAADGHDVTLATAWAPDDGHDAGVEVVHLWGDDLRPLAADVDVVVAMTGVLHDHPWLADLRAAAGRGGRLHVVADAYDPVLFEVLAGFTVTPEPERSERIADASRRMCGALRWADLVLCATSAQRHLLLGVLAAGALSVAYAFRYQLLAFGRAPVGDDTDRHARVPAVAAERGGTPLRHGRPTSRAARRRRPGTCRPPP